MNEGYTEMLSRVLVATKTPMPPTITSNNEGYWFNDKCFGEDKEAAIKARDEYYAVDDLKDVL